MVPDPFKMVEQISREKHIEPEIFVAAVVFGPFRSFWGIAR